MDNFNIDRRINMLYDFLYNPVNRSCFEINKISFDDSEDNYIMHSTKENVDDLIKDNFNGKHMTIYQNTKYLIVKRFSDNSLPCLLIISKFDNNDCCKITYLLNELSIKMKTKHLLISLLNIVIPYNNAKNIYANLDEELKDSNILCQFYEGFFKVDSLGEYLIKNKINNWKFIIFQIIHTLAVINKSYDGFSFNNLNKNNILIFLRKNKDNVEYNFENMNFKFDDVIFDVKLFDFSECSFPKINKIKRKNDLELFYESLVEYLDNESKKFLKNNMENSNYEELLNDKFFNNNVVDSESEVSENNSSDNYYKGVRYIQQGGEVNKPKFIEKNSPFISNDNAKVHAKRMSENPIREPPVLSEHKVYDTQAYREKRKEDTMAPPMHIPLSDGNRFPFGYPTYYDHDINVRAPIQKTMNITLANPTGNHTMMSRIYEDVLPQDPVFSSLTLKERNTNVKFIRDHMTRFGDGEEMDVTGVDNTLLSYIRMMDVSPYTTNNNPYKTLPDRMLLYSGAYPIRYDKNNILQPSKNSMGVNIRIYQLSVGEFLSRNINNSISQLNFDLWREIHFYEFIREKILKEKICPHFL